MTAGDTSNDRDLVVRAQAGDGIALSRLYSRHRNRLRLLVRYRLGRRLRHQLESEDVLQSAFVRAVRRFAQDAPGERHFLGWIITAIENTLRDRARRLGAKKRAGGEVELPDPDMLIDAHAPRPSEHAREREDLEGLERALDRLSARDRQLILSTRVEGRTAAEAGAALGITAAAAQRAVTRALARLAGRMASAAVR